MSKTKITEPCQKEGCKGDGIYRIAERRFLQDGPRPFKRWLLVCAVHEKFIGDANDAWAEERKLKL
tara:strand:- start:8960 stop:9157 length:198 start_codon:yes stop_codon:yes gene_type:complete